MARGIKTGGRTKGVPNKNTAEVKEMILTALSNVGGPKYLARQAEENPAAFMTLVGKVLPMQVTGENGGPMKHSLTIRFGDAGSDNRE